MFFLAVSPALRMASATSLALPRPTPTRPFWSPTATMALNEKRRPPLTTLAQRFTWITRSSNSDFGCIRFAGEDVVPASVPPSLGLLELQSAGASAVGERLDAPVVEVAAAIEGHLYDALLLRALSEKLADRGLAPTLPLPVEHRLTSSRLEAWTSVSPA